MPQLTPALGYRPEYEDRKWLQNNSAPFPCQSKEVSAAPDQIDHRSWLVVENQGQMSSCCGHGDSTCLEVCNFYDTGGQVIQLSRMYAYLTAQKAGGLFGSDQGATIAGAAQANAAVGICLEAVFPYPGTYTTNIPPAAHVQAKEHKLLRYTKMNTYADIYNWFATGQGAVEIGVRWVPSLRDTTGVVEKLSGSSSGFHAIALTGYSTRKAKDGRKYIWLVNSWGVSWGNNGWAEIAPSVIDQWCKRKDYEELIGMSDLEEYAPREPVTFDML